MMFDRVRQLRISLAAKCQLLFGAAVVLIIAAALFVPWRRIEQLTEQLNERTAAALTEYAVADHIAAHAAGRGASTRPTTLPATRPANRSAAARGSSTENVPQPRLVSMGPRRDSSDLSKFEGRALNHFRQSEALFYAAYYDRADGSVGYRYARPLTFGDACAACHAAVAAPPSTAATSPASRPATLPAAAGIASDGRPLLPLPTDRPVDA